MKNTIFVFVKLCFFWLLLFAIQHTFFLIYNYSELKEICFNQIILSYFYSLRLDISATAYLICFPSLILIVSFFFKNKKTPYKLFNIFNISFIIFCILIGVADTALYSVWSTKINGKALSYIMYPKEAVASFTSVPYILFILIFIIESILLIYIYKILIKPCVKVITGVLSKIIFSIVLLLLLFTAIRGGLQKYPLNRSNAYFSKHHVLNCSVLNGFWNFMEIIINSDIRENPYMFFSKDKADAILKLLNETPADSTEMILNCTKLNIVLILMESVSAECMSSLNGVEKLMPNLDSLTKESLLFTNFYANGFRTEQGLIALLSSFPSQPQTSIMRKFDKLYKLPNFARILGDNGYSENYYYSGNIDFANTKGYLNSSGFSKIFYESNYNWIKKTQWGAYDEELFACHLKNAKIDKQPFFSIIMTSTNHEPFAADVNKIFNQNSSADAYKNCVHYTDKCLFEYLQKAKLEPWYKNTLFIITSDHAHTFPLNRAYNSPERHKIPLLFYGDVIKNEFKGKVIEKIGSQIDLPAMLLSQLNINYKQFLKSKNLLNKYSPEYAFYSFDNGFGFITPIQTIVYDHNLKKIVYRKNILPFSVDQEISDKGKAYLQIMFDEYIGFNN